MIEEQALACLQSTYRIHIGSVEIKIKYIEVLRHSFLSNGLGNDDDVSLRQPTQYHLSDRLAVLLGNRCEHFVLEDVVLSLGKRAPRFDLDIVLSQELLCCDLLVEWMRLNLVHGRHHIVMDDEVHYTVGMKVADADGLDPTLAIKFLHRAPRAKNISVRLVNEVANSE